MSRAAKLPGLFALRSDDPSLTAWAQAVNEHLEVRAGARGDPLERAVVQRDLDALAEKVAAIKPTATTSADALVREVVASKLFKDALPQTSESASTSLDEMASIRASIDGLSRQVSAVSTAPYAQSFSFGGGPYGQRWYLTADTGLAAGVGEYTTNLGDVLRKLYDLDVRMGKAEDETARILREATDYIAQLFRRVEALEAKP